MYTQCYEVTTLHTPPRTFCNTLRPFCNTPRSLCNTPRILRNSPGTLRYTKDCLLHSLINWPTNSMCWLFWDWTRWRKRTGTNHKRPPSGRGLINVTLHTSRSQTAVQALSFILSLSNISWNQIQFFQSSLSAFIFYRKKVDSTPYVWLFLVCLKS